MPNPFGHLQPSLSQTSQQPLRVISLSNIMGLQKVGTIPDSRCRRDFSRYIVDRDYIYSVHDIATNELIMKSKKHYNDDAGAHLSFDGTMLCCGDSVYDCTTGKVIGHVDAIQYASRCAKCDGGFEYRYSLGSGLISGPYLKCVNLHSFKEIWKVKGDYDVIIDISVDGSMIAVGKFLGGNHSTTLIEALTGKTICVIPEEQSPSGFSLDGLSFFVQGKIYSIPDGKNVFQSESSYSLIGSKDNSLLFMGQVEYIDSVRHYTVSAYNVREWKREKLLARFNVETSIEMSSDGTRFRIGDTLWGVY